ncbi:MAG: hypothetical protein ACP5RP_03635 [Candidatus Micrarchaeia archaeon]
MANEGGEESREYDKYQSIRSLAGNFKAMGKTYEAAWIYKTHAEILLANLQNQDAKSFYKEAGDLFFATAKSNILDQKYLAAIDSVRLSVECYEKAGMTDKVKELAENVLPRYEQMVYMGISSGQSKENINGVTGKPE